MRPIRKPTRLAGGGALIVLLLLLSPVSTLAQDRLRSMPGHERYERVGRAIPTSVESGALEVVWKEGGKALEYSRGGWIYRYELESRSERLVGEGAVGGRRPLRLAAGPERGRQFEEVFSPDGRYRAFYRDRNLWLSDPDGRNELQITTDGSVEGRIKNGTASWVYGEELGQRTAIWWSPDSRKLAYYRFDESEVEDYHLQLDQTKVQSRIDIEAYPKAGSSNPLVELYVYDLDQGTTTRLDIRDGEPFTDDLVGHYVYGVEWSPSGEELLLNRTNRRQNIMEFAACNPGSGRCRVVVREEWPESWTDNSPTRYFLEDGHHFIWASERTGWRNYYLYDLSGELLTTLTDHPFEVNRIVGLDEERGHLYYMARSGDNHMKLQLHRVRLDGAGDVRLTDPAYHHTISLSPTREYFVAVSQRHDTAPVTRLYDAGGEPIALLGESDLTRYEELGLRSVELFTFTSADGETELHGMLHRPSDFDPSRSYPLLVSVYGGPETNGARETFTLPHPLTEYGFLVVTFDLRTAGGRGKEFLDAIYGQLGVVEVDDLAAGVRALHERPYVDPNRVGVFGTSYGGYVSLMALLRYPELFHAASAASAVTDWKHYDTIYTERYMWTPQGNPEGYEAGSALSYIDQLEGRLMIYYGTADNNVHPSNSLELIAALQRAGKSFEVQVGPDLGHTALGLERMMEFFIEALVLEGRRI